MDRSVVVTRKLLEDTLTVLANASFENPLELVPSANTPGGSTLNDLINEVIKEFEHATTSIIYTERAKA